MFDMFVLILIFLSEVEKGNVSCVWYIIRKTDFLFDCFFVI